MTKHFIFFIFFIFTAIISAADITQKKINADVFDAVISEISKNHYDGNFRQKYAHKINEFRQKSVKSVNNDELARCINHFFRQLKDSHFGINAPSTYSKNTVLLENSVRLIESDSKVLVSEILPGSVFCRGDEILSVNGRVPDPNSRTGKALQIFHMLNIGEDSKKMQVEIIRNNQKITVEFKSRRLQKKLSFFKLGEMPALIEDYKSHLLDKSTGYIRFNIFTPNAVQNLKKDVRTIFRNTPKLIIDLRNNDGGLIMMGVSMASFLHDERVNFGTSVISGQPLNPKSFPQKERYKGRIYILIGRNSYSTAEIFAQSMKEANAAEIIGEKSSGMCLPSAFIALPHGFKLQTVMGDYFSAGNYRIEGNGVIPDKIIKISPAQLKNNSDPLIEYVLKAKGML